MKRIFAILVGCWLVIAAQVNAQHIINLAGLWDFAMGDSARYTDYVMLPGSMLTNDKGYDVDIHTQWTGSLYDSSYYFNEVSFLPDARETLCGKGMVQAYGVCAAGLERSAHHAVPGASTY